MAYWIFFALDAVTLRLETYIVQLGVRTFYKLLAFCPGLLHRISFCVLYFCTDDA